MLRLSERLNDLSRVDKSESSRIPNSRRVASSILKNITRIINARKNSIAIDLDYGLDPKLLKSNFSESETRDFLMREMESAIRKYEKRIVKIECSLLGAQSGFGTVTFAIAAVTHDGLTVRASSRLLADKTIEVDAV